MATEEFHKESLDHRDGINLAEERERINLRVAYSRMVNRAALRNPHRSAQQIVAEDQAVVAVILGLRLSLEIEEVSNDEDVQEDATRATILSERMKHDGTMHSFPKPWNDINFQCSDNVINIPGLKPLQLSKTRAGILDIVILEPFRVFNYDTLSAALAPNKKYKDTTKVERVLATHMCYLRKDLQLALETVDEQLPELLPSRLGIGWSLFPTHLKTPA